MRASIRIGEISRELDKAERVRTDLHPSDGRQTKTEQLEAAGISTSTANRYEQLTGGREEQAQKVASNAAEHYLAQQRQNEEA